MPTAPYIIHISTPTSWRGGEQQTLYLIQELAERGFRQTLIAAKHGELARRAASLCEVAAVPAGNAHLLRWAMNIARYSYARRAQIIHAHDSHAHTFAVLAATIFRSKVPVVVSRRVDVPIGKTKASLRKYNHPRVGAIICVSDCVKGIVSDSVTRKSLLHTVHDGIRLERFSIGSTHALRRMLNCNDDVNIIGNVAALAGHKDHVTFLRVASKLHAFDPSLVFVIVGEGQERGAIEHEIMRLGLEKVVHLLGHRTNIEELLPDMNVFLFTSKTEGLGSSVLDAMACGVPVVATKAGGVPELIAHGYNGLLAEVANADELATHVQSILSNMELREAIVTNATEAVKNFTTSVMASKTIAVYNSVLRKQGSEILQPLL